jgi:tetratricopeptide (TPR) repeat protein
MITFLESVRILMLKFIKLATFPLWWPLSRLPLFKAIAIKSKIDKFERMHEFEKARKYRKIWLEKLPLEYTAPLWRSEGNDLLFKQDKYEESLVAYRNSIRALELSPSSVGITDPLRLYFGAAVSALMVGELDNAEKYLNEFLSYYNSFARNKKAQKYAAKFTSGLQWLRENIYGDGKRCHLKLVANPTLHSDG